LIDYTTMELPELEAAIIKNEAQVRELRKEQQVIHSAAEAVRRAIPIVPTDKDITMDPLSIGTEEGMLQWMSKQPQNFLDLLKKKLNGGE
jgi:hypothetical protein